MSSEEIQLREMLKKVGKECRQQVEDGKKFKEQAQKYVEKEGVRYNRMLDTALSQATKDLLKTSGINSENPADEQKFHAIVSKCNQTNGQNGDMVVKSNDHAPSNSKTNGPNGVTDVTSNNVREQLAEAEQKIKAMKEERVAIEKKHEASETQQDKENDDLKFENEELQEKLKAARLLAEKNNTGEREMEQEERIKKLKMKAEKKRVKAEKKEEKRKKKEKKAKDEINKLTKENLKQIERHKKELETAKAAGKKTKTIKLTDEQVKAAKRKYAKKVIEDTIEVAKTQGTLNEMIKGIQDGTDYASDMSNLKKDVRICKDLATETTSIQFVGIYKVGTYLENEIKAKNISAAKLLAELAEKEIVISSANCTSYRQLKKAMDVTKAYKFLYCCTAPWSGNNVGPCFGIREMLAHGILLDALKSFENKSPGLFANLKV